jgi:hypothetical protein
MTNEIKASEAAQQFRALVIELSEDNYVISKGGKPSELSQSQKRMWIRAAFATLEALIYVWKQMAVEYHPDPNCSVITHAERVFAREQEYCLSEKGEVKIRGAKVSLKTNIKFAYKLLAKAGSTTSELDTSGQEWDSLLKAIAVRDRITHPKSTGDLIITGDEYKTVSRAFGWVLVTFAGLQTKMIEKARRNLENGN